MNRSTYLCVALLVLFVQVIQARTATESELLAASEIGEEITHWLSKLNTKPKSIAIFNIVANPPFEPEYGNIIESELLKQLRDKQTTRVISCPECRIPQVIVKEDRLVVSKGAPDSESFKQIGKKLEVEALLTIDLYRTSLSVIAQVTLYSSATADVISAQRFRVAAVNLSDAAMQYSANLGIGLVLIGKSTGSGRDIPFSANIRFLEELGIGKGGITIGGIFGGNQGTLGHIDATLGLRGRFGGSGLTYMFLFGPGFGITGEAKGISAHGGFDLYLGTFTILGLDATFLLPLSQTRSTLSGYAGLHVGFAFGK